MTGVVFRWARYAAWALLGAGFLLLVINAAVGAAWGPLAVGLLIAGYAAGVVAVLPIISRTLRAFFEALTVFFPASVALGIATALLIGVMGLAAWAWVASPW
jgi:hypothetical protein